MRAALLVLALFAPACSAAVPLNGVVDDVPDADLDDLPDADLVCDRSPNIRFPEQCGVVDLEDCLKGEGRNLDLCGLGPLVVSWIDVFDVVLTGEP